MRAQRGQATFEVVALLPLMAGVGLVVLQLLAAGAARELAGHAAEAGAVAILQGRDPRAAARAAVPGWSAGAVRVVVRGRSVRVRLRPRALTRELGEALAAEAVATAGGRVVSELLGRLRAAFIADAPRETAFAAPELAAAPAPHVGLLCEAGLAGVAGAALALRLAAAAGSPAALVCRWQPGHAAAGGGAARGAARRLAARVAARDIPARAAGRLVLVALDGEPGGVLADANRALAAAGAAGAPAVVVVAGPRPAALDALLAERDTIVVATGPEAGALAVAGAASAADLGPPVIACELDPPLPARLLAGAGLAAAGALGRALDPACRAVA